MLIDHDIKEAYKEAKSKIEDELWGAVGVAEAVASDEYASIKEALTEKSTKCRKKYASKPKPVTVPPDLGDLILTRDRDADLSALAEEYRVAERAIFEVKKKKQADATSAAEAKIAKLTYTTRIKIVEAWLVEDSTIKAELLAVLKK